jgi:hypothetical protein
MLGLKKHNWDFATLPIMCVVCPMIKLSWKPKHTASWVRKVLHIKFVESYA